MKGFLFLFSFYLLLLMVLPCPDGNNTSGQAQPVIAATQQDHNPNHAEACPPFCACNCCYTTTTLMPATSFNYTGPVSLSEPTVCFYTHKQLSDFKDHIWQPPRVS
ncbi:MAG: hypothetical protein J7539_06380 [Niabella sp.]|nr:hypothetical protein [Niabella sp.]